MSFELPALNYAYDALEPHIDALTMEIHHTKHHNAYTNNLNAAIEANGLENKSIEELLSNHHSIAAVRNNGGVGGITASSGRPCPPQEVAPPAELSQLLSMHPSVPLMNSKPPSRTLQ